MQDYDKIDSTDKLSIIGLKSFAPGVPLKIEGKKTDGTTYSFPVRTCTASVRVAEDTRLHALAEQMSMIESPLSLHQVNHTFNDNQINWFKNGSALNAMAAQFKAKK